jgi:hypothetical protein
MPRAIVGALLGLALLLAGCTGGGTTPARQPQSLSATTAHGSLRYTLAVTYRGGQQCLTATYVTAAPNALPTRTTLRRCDKPATTGHPVLIQAHASAESLVVDVPPGNVCGGPVLGGRTAATLRPLAGHCSTPAPAFRVTVLPAARRLVLSGIPGAPVVNFPRHPCTVGVCVTPLA